MAINAIQNHKRLLLIKEYQEGLLDHKVTCSIVTPLVDHEASWSFRKLIYF